MGCFLRELLLYDVEQYLVVEYCKCCSVYDRPKLTFTHVLIYETASEDLLCLLIVRYSSEAKLRFFIPLTLFANDLLSGRLRNEFSLCFPQITKWLRTVKS